MRGDVVSTVPTPGGDARAHTTAAASPRATLVLGHGAGGGIEAADLVALATVLPRSGITVVRVEQPWRVAGKRVAGPPPTLDRAWSAVLEALSPKLAAVGPVVTGGRSAGARVACRTAAATGAAAVVALAFPLHPPGRPERSRLGELEDCPVPTLVVQGDRDAFGGPGDFPQGRAYAVHAVPGADHSFRVPRGHDRAAVLEAVAAAVAAWLLDRLG